MRDAETTTMECDECVICMATDGSVEEQMCELECGHRFHTRCALSWFRQNPGCPLCRAVPIAKRVVDLHARARFLRAQARRRDCPADLKRAVERWRAAETTQKETRRARIAFERTNRALLKEARDVRKKERHADAVARRRKREVGIYSSKDVPMPLLVRK